MATSRKSITSQLEDSHIAYQALELVASQLREDLARANARADVTLASLDEAVTAYNAEHTRRQFEGASYRRQLEALRAKGQGAKRLAPSQDLSIPDEDLTPAQRAIRAHRASQEA